VTPQNNDSATKNDLEITHGVHEIVAGESFKDKVCLFCGISGKIAEICRIGNHLILCQCDSCNKVLLYERTYLETRSPTPCIVHSEHSKKDPSYHSGV
jgi:hypothetical protein